MVLIVVYNPLITVLAFYVYYGLEYIFNRKYAMCEKFQ